MDDLAALWRAFWRHEILPAELVESYSTPQVAAESEGAHLHYGYGLWIDAASPGRPGIYITGGDAGVSFWSRCERDLELEATVMSNTTDGAWPLVEEIVGIVRP